jgi:hypothetical protein
MAKTEREKMKAKNMAGMVGRETHAQLLILMRILDEVVLLRGLK